MKKYQVTTQDEGLTLEKFVRHNLKDAPLSFIYKLFRKKDVRINNVKCDAKVKVKAGDEISIYISDQQYDDFKNINQTPANDQLKKYIVYEDDNIIVINKPSGMLVQKDKNNSRSLDQLVKAYYFYTHPEHDRSGFSSAPAHRIDRNTSGLVIFGKNVKTMQALMDIFKNHEEIEKHYLTVVVGHIEKGGTINKPLKKNQDTGLVTVASQSEGGKTAITEYHPIGYHGDFTLLDVKIITGRTHQIRAHMKSINHPIIGDPKYGDFRVNKIIKEQTKLDHQLLHSTKIIFSIKQGDLKYLNNINIECPLDDKTLRLIDKLDNIKY